MIVVDMFFSYNYIGESICINRDFFIKNDGFMENYDGSEVYEFILRTLNIIDENSIKRIEKILYHKRQNSRLNENKKALLSFFSSSNVSIENGLIKDRYKINYIHDNEPLVSLLIPTRDGYDILSKCIDSIIKKTEYKINNYCLNPDFQARVF